MKKKNVKIISLILILVLTAVPGLYFSASYGLPPLISRINKIKSSGEYKNGYNAPAFTFSNDDAEKGYKTAKDILSKEENFYDLIVDSTTNFGYQLCNCEDRMPEIEISKGDGDSKSAFIKNCVDVYNYEYEEIFYPGIVEEGDAELVEGRWINNENDLSGGNPIELMVSESCPYEMGKKLWICLYMQDESWEAAPCIIVGKIKMNNIVPNVGEINYSSQQKLDNTVLVQNPLDEYNISFKDSGLTNKNSIYNLTEVSFRIAYKDSEAEHFDDTVIKAAQASSASICVNYSLNRLNQDIKDNAIQSRIILLSALLALSSITETVIVIIKIIKISKKELHYADTEPEDYN